MACGEVRVMVDMAKGLGGRAKERTALDAPCAMEVFVGMEALKSWSFAKPDGLRKSIIS